MFPASFGARAKAYLIDHFVLCIPVGFVAAIFSQNIIDSLGLNIDYSGGMSILVPLVAMVYSAIPVLGILDTVSNLLGSHTLHVAMFAQSLSIIISIVLIEAFINTLQELFGDKLTVGKCQMKIGVLRTNGNRCSVFIKFLRNIFRSLNKFVFFIPIISMIFTTKKQTLYDLLLRTVTVWR